jgi:hypothetical protein
MGAYEAGFLKGSEVTASVYRAMAATMQEMWRAQQQIHSEWANVWRGRRW